jgi:hypothetical protein
MEATYAEARAVLDAQNDTMGDIDSKAMRTVRFNVLLVGVLITAARLTGPSVFDPALLHLSVGCLVLSTILGIVTYNESYLFVGPQGMYVEYLADGTPPDVRWDQDLLQTFAGMISENTDELEWNSWLLTVILGALLLGIVFGVLATAI